MTPAGRLLTTICLQSCLPKSHTIATHRNSGAKTSPRSSDTPILRGRVFGSSADPLLSEGHHNENMGKGSLFAIDLSKAALMCHATRHRNSRGLNAIRKLLRLSSRNQCAIAIMAAVPIRTCAVVLTCSQGSECTKHPGPVAICANQETWYVACVSLRIDDSIGYRQGRWGAASNQLASIT